MTAATLIQEQPARVEVELQPYRWAALTRQAFERLCVLLYEAVGQPGATAGEAGAMLDGAESTLYYAHHVPATDALLFQENDPIHCVSLLHAARAQLLLATQAYRSGEHQLSDKEAFALPNVLALVDELIAALDEFALDSNALGRLEAFAAFRPDLAAKKVAAAPIAMDDEAEDRRELARKANYQINMMAEGISRLLNSESNEETAMYIGMLARIQQLSDIVFHAVRLHGDGVGQWGEHDDLRCLQRAFEGML